MSGIELTTSYKQALSFQYYTPFSDGEPSEKCGEINFSLDYDFQTQTLKLKIIQVKEILIPSSIKLSNFYFT